MNRLLIKIASRERPDELREALVEIKKHWSHEEGQCAVLISADDDDTKMADFIPPPGISPPHYGSRVSKIEAINRDIAECEWPWDVVLVLADDMVPVVKNFDTLVLDLMNSMYPDGDGELWLSDGRQHKFCTIPCVGRKRYESMGYIYHPSYASYCPDVEQTERGLAEGKMTKVEGAFAMHLHSMFSTPRKAPRKPDDLLRHNQSFKSRDRDNLIQRRLLGWPTT